MKTNKAPKKVYLHLTTGNRLLNGKYYERKPAKIRNNDKIIEYTRTDTIIEKVSGWLKDCATFTDMNGKKRVDEEMYKATVEDFKKYTKGE